METMHGPAGTKCFPWGVVTRAHAQQMNEGAIDETRAIQSTFSIAYNFNSLSKIHVIMPYTHVLLIVTMATLATLHGIHSVYQTHDYVSTRQ